MLIRTLPAGYGYEFAGLSREELKAGSSTLLIFALSIVFVFLFLAALYESWQVPFSVLLAVPVGMLGAILTLTLIPSLVNNVYAQIGMITLIGLSAKNAILIVEFAKERVDRGIPVVEATLEAVKLRLRPISDDFYGIYSGCIATGPCNRRSQRSQINHWMDRAGRYAGRHLPGHFHRAGIICCDNETFLWKGKIGYLKRAGSGINRIKKVKRKKYKRLIV